jgi:p-aminobenzoyl-glutamate transporter AbgT
MKSTTLGAILANILSVGTRALGYFLYAVILAIYRRDPKFIILFVCIFVGVGIVIWWTLS